MPAPRSSPGRWGRSRAGIRWIPRTWRRSWTLRPRRRSVRSRCQARRRTSWISTSPRWRHPRRRLPCGASRAGTRRSSSLLSPAPPSRRRKRRRRSPGNPRRRRWPLRPFQSPHPCRRRGSWLPRRPLPESFRSRRPRRPSGDFLSPLSPRSSSWRWSGSGWESGSGPGRLLQRRSRRRRRHRFRWRRRLPSPRPWRRSHPRALPRFHRRPCPRSLRRRPPSLWDRRRLR